LIEELNDIVNKLKKKSDIAQDLLNIVNKEKSNFEHKYIEFAELEDLVDEYKIEKFDEYRNLLLKRRNIKNEAINLKNVKEQIDAIFENTDRLHKRTVGYIDKAILSTESAIAQTVPEDLDKQLVKEVPYNNFKERMNLMKQLQPKYDKIIVKDEENKLICYNKSKKAS
jgi:flagellar biosynthesis/type III secretory pathway chaperone